MRRTAQGDEFRSNVHRGGSVEGVTLDPAFEETAVRAAQIMGLRVAGVDMLEGDDGPLVMEVNSSPGLEGIEPATKLDVAGAIIDYIDNQVAFPEIDVRQRLSGLDRLRRRRDRRPRRRRPASARPSRSPGSPSATSPSSPSTAAPRSIPNPGRRILEDGDRLLCFGRLEEMRSMIPARRRRARKVRRLPKEPIHEG